MFRQVADRLLLQRKTVLLDELGEYDIIVVARDQMNNTAQKQIVVVISAPDAPRIMLSGSSSLILEAGTSWNDPGATIVDDVDDSLTEALVSNSSKVDSSVIGDFVIEYRMNGTNSRFVRATVRTRLVRVRDTTAPVGKQTGTLESRMPGTSSEGEYYTVSQLWFFMGRSRICQSGYI